MGLLLLYTAQVSFFTKANEPDWVTAWLSKREEAAEKKEQKAKNETPVNKEAQAKRQAVRHENILSGIDDLQIWLKDLLRNGLIHVPESAHSLFDSIARRMIDAQASGLALRLNAIQKINFFSENWKYQLTDQLGLIYLLAESYQNLDKQPEAWQNEIRTQIGYTQLKDEILSEEAIADKWMVLHKVSRKVNELNTETFWLYGKQSNRFAVYLNFITPGTVSELNLLPGSTYEGQVCFYKGIGTLRALFKTCELLEETFTPICCTHLQEASCIYRKAFQQNPFTGNVPLLVENIKLAIQGKQVYIEDIHGEVMPVQISDSVKIDILSVTGGKPFSAFLLGYTFYWELNTIWYQSDHYTWKDELN